MRIYTFLLGLFAILSLPSLQAQCSLIVTDYTVLNKDPVAGTYDVQICYTWTDAMPTFGNGSQNIYLNLYNGAGMQIGFMIFDNDVATGSSGSACGTLTVSSPSPGNYLFEGPEVPYTFDSFTSTQGGLPDIENLTFNLDFDGTCITPNLPLPVELVSFEATLADNKVLLQWQTITELNNSGFEIQRSKDGQNWQTLDFVKGYGTTVEAQLYKWTDENPLLGISYYQLKQVDIDGSSTTSDLISVEIRKQTDFLEVYPNPARTVAYYNVPDMELVHNIQLFDMYGKLIKMDASITGALSLEDIQSGLYVIVINTRSRQFQKMIVKQ